MYYDEKKIINVDVRCPDEDCEHEFSVNVEIGITHSSAIEVDVIDVENN